MPSTTIKQEATSKPKSVSSKPLNTTAAVQKPRKMAKPPAVGMGRVCSRRGPGVSKKPRRVASARTQGVNASVETRAMRPMTSKSRTFSAFPTFMRRARAHRPISARAEQTVTRVAQTGHDVGLFVEPFVYRGDVQRHVRVGVVQAPDALGRGHHAHKLDAQRPAPLDEIDGRHRGAARG